MRPKLNTVSKVRYHKTTPNMCGIVFINPKFFPDAVSIMLFGPGVPD